MVGINIHDQETSAMAKKIYERQKYINAAKLRGSWEYRQKNPDFKWEYNKFVPCDQCAGSGHTDCTEDETCYDDMEKFLNK